MATFFPLPIEFAVLWQVEYYFSDCNLARDVWLRRHMDADGWVPLWLLASFPRVAMYGVGLEFLCAALSGSQVVQLNPTGEFVRPACRGERWVFPENRCRRYEWRAAPAAAAGCPRDAGWPSTDTALRVPAAPPTAKKNRTHRAETPSRRPRYQARGRARG